MNKRTALVFGATGLVGGFVVQELEKLEEYRRVVVFSRREIPVNADKTELVIDNLESPDKLAGKIKGDDVYCCLGTTINKAGSKEAFRKVDLDLPSNIAGIASKNGMKNFAVISSLGADDLSRNFYLRTKGEMEKAVSAHPFGHLVIVRPSLLTGHRKEFRLSETMAKMVMPAVDLLLTGRLMKYRSIKAHTVARAMVSLVIFPREKTVFESDELQHIAQDFNEN